MIIVNRCAAGAVYIQFWGSFKGNKLTLKYITEFVIDAQLLKMLIFTHVYFFMNSHIFHHLKLEIALAIPASNDEKNTFETIQQDKC